MRALILVIAIILCACAQQPVDNNSDGLVPAVKEV